MVDLLARPWLPTPEYRAYVEAQREKTSRFRTVRHKRIGELLGIVLHHVPDIHGRVLCVGCRNLYELDQWQSIGCDPVGIDLVKMVPGVFPMDMHQLQFEDQSFDVVFGSHVLEHAYDLPQVLKEWARVTKPGGIWVLEMPVRFETSATDRLDVGSLDGLRRYFDPEMKLTELYAGDGQTAIRLIARVHG